MHRFDYIWLDRRILAEHFSAADYFDHQHAGDRLVHRVRLNTTTTGRGPNFWRLDSSILQSTEVVEAINGEASTLLSTLCSSSNPGFLGSVDLVVPPTGSNAKNTANMAERYIAHDI